MKLEAIVKYFSPKSMTPGAVPCGATTETLTITDVMASLGLVSARAAIGIELFLAKAGVLPAESITSYIEQLAIERGRKHTALKKMTDHHRSIFLRTLAKYIFRDYALSAASLVVCSNCAGAGLIDAEVFTMKSARRGDTWLEPCERREQIRVICKPCNGKGQLKNECRCRGRGEVLNKKKSEIQGVPVYTQCRRCSGRGYPRLKDPEIFKALGIPETTWRRNYKQLFDRLVEHCHIEEAYAERKLNQVTR